MAKLYLKNLYLVHACYEQTSKFRSYFGDDVNINIANCEKYASQFSFWWAAYKFLSRRAAWIYRERKDIEIAKQLSKRDFREGSITRAEAIAFSVAYNSKENVYKRRYLKDQWKNQ